MPNPTRPPAAPPVQAGQAHQPSANKVIRLPTAMTPEQRKDAVAIKRLLDAAAELKW